jgi:IclR family acetate operon transcriptional repressor
MIESRAASRRSTPSRSPKVPKARKTYTIAALRASMDVLDKFGQRELWSLDELTEEVGQVKSRVFRILKTFEESGYVVRDERTGAYRLGSRLLALGAASARYEQLRWRALPPLQMLAESTGESAHIGILFGQEAVTVQLVEGRHSVRMHGYVGKRSPSHANALGKVLLAYFPEPEIEEFVHSANLVAVTPNTIVDPESLKLHLREVRASGYAIDNEECELGMRCVAAPITDHTGLVVAAVSISAPTTRLGPDKAVALVPSIKECARMVSRMLGSPSLANGRR